MEVSASEPSDVIRVCRGLTEKQNHLVGTREMTCVLTLSALDMSTAVCNLFLAI